MKTALLILGLLLLFAAEILRVYFIMPFPGSQEKDTINLAYWLHRNINWLRVVGLLMIAIPAAPIFKRRATFTKTSLVVFLALYAIVFYLFNFRFQADKMFFQPTNLLLAGSNENKIDLDKLVIGVTINGESKAYPIQLVGYHHQVRDSIGGKAVMVTYCTVCRTGRVFSPEVNGYNENFRLVGMDHFNAMFEDGSTGSWWQQATGEAIAGPLKGKKLFEFPSHQMTLRAWLQQNPQSMVMQPDQHFTKEYEDLALYDNGTIESNLEGRDPASWQKKSWVIGVRHDTVAKAFDWNNLQKKQFIEDSLPQLPLLLVLGTDSASYFVWNRQVNGKCLHFSNKPGTSTLTDLNTGSTWTPEGVCIDGPLEGQQLRPVQSYQEFWHSWQQFQPQTVRYED